MKYLPTLTLIILLMGVKSDSFGQVKALVNEVATDVDHKKSNLTALYNKYPRYMDGFEKAPYDPFTKVPPRLNIQNFADLQSSDSDLLAQNNSETPFDNIKLKKKKDDFIYFEGATANLINSSLPKISAYSEGIKDGISKSILIKGWYKSEDKQSQKLIEKRLDVCKLKLEENGVPSNLILTSILGSNKEKRHLSLLVQ